jgi:hypothetical protein
MFSPEDEATLMESITVAEQQGDISPAKAAALREILMELQSPDQPWESWLAGLLGLAGAFFGVRAKQTLDKRPRTLPDPEDVALLKQMVAERKAATGGPNAKP